MVNPIKDKEKVENQWLGIKNNHRNQNIELNKLILHRFDIIIESSVLVAHIRNRKQQRETRENRCRGVRRYQVNDADLITRARHGLELHLIRIVREK